MKQILSILSCLALLFFASCDQRTSEKERLENAISEFNQKQTVLETQTFYPETYTEIKTDSIISDTFKVSISNYSNMQKTIVLTEKPSVKTEALKAHRVFESDVLVAVQNKVVFEGHFSAVDFKNNNTSEFWKDATLEHIWVNQDQSDETQLLLGISIVNPKSKAYKYYEMRIDHFGKQSIQLIEETS